MSRIIVITPPKTPPAGNAFAGTTRFETKQFDSSADAIAYVKTLPETGQFIISVDGTSVGFGVASDGVAFLEDIGD